jgi:hypothetical protein
MLFYYIKNLQEKRGDYAGISGALKNLYQQKTAPSGAACSLL